MYFGLYLYNVRDYFYLEYNGSVIFNYDNDFCYILKMKVKIRNYYMKFDRILCF